MWYTIIEIFVYLTIASLLGFGLGWLLRGRRGGEELAVVRRAGDIREAESIKVWQGKLKLCEEQCADLKRALQGAESKSAPTRESKKGKSSEMDGSRSIEESVEVAAVESAGKSNRTSSSIPVGERKEKSAQGSTKDAKDDAAAKKRVKRLVERASGEIDTDGEQLDPKVVREQMKMLVRSVSGGQKSPRDNLKKIYGIGPKFEKLLNGYGITGYQQIARMTAGDLRIVAAAIEAFPDRVERDNWVKGAAEAYRQKYGKAPD